MTNKDRRQAFFYRRLLCIRAFLECVARDFRYPDWYNDGGGETDAEKRPVLPAVFHRCAASCGGDSCFARSADVNVKKCGGHHADPARQHVRPEFHTR